MRIRRIRLRNVKRHADLDLRLSPGVTIVRGPNEAGKSTIQQALELALFRRVTSTAQDMADLRRWGAAAQDPTVELEFDDESGAGRLRKVFAGAKGTVELTVAGSTVTDPGAADLRLAELTGVASEKFFRSTASIRQQELDELDKDEGALRDRLQQSISGADHGTWAARRKLEEALRRYRSEGVRNPGALKSTRDRIVQLTRSAAEGEAALGRLARDRQALSVARTSRAAADAELAEQRRLLALSERAVQIESRLRDAADRYARYKRAAEVRETIGSMARPHQTAPPLPALRSGVETVRHLERAIAELRALLANEHDTATHDVPHQVPQARPMAVLGSLLLAAGLAAGVGGSVTGLPLALAAGSGLLLVLTGVVCILGARAWSRQAADLRTSQTLREQELTRRARDRTDRDLQLEETERRRDRMLADLTMPDLASAEIFLASETARVAEIEQLNAEYRGVLGDDPPTGELAGLRDRLAAEADEMRHALAGMGELGEAPQRSRQRHATAVAALQAERERAVDEESRAAARVEQDGVDAEEVAATVEALQAAAVDLAVIERRVRVYQQTLDALDAAEQATMKKAARYLEEEMGEDVARITGGRYRRIQVDESELTFNVWAPERNGWVDVDDLSQGTLDQFYLAARLALVRQVTQRKNPPLVFDDPFITFDDTRARRALGLLKSMATDHQVIYLTCSSRYDQVADLVVELPGPASDAPVATTTRSIRNAVRTASPVRTEPAATSPSRRGASAAAPGQLSLLAPEVALEPLTQPVPVAVEPS
jgi:uncharacterized protein YhaN